MQILGRDQRAVVLVLCLGLTGCGKGDDSRSVASAWWIHPAAEQVAMTPDQGRSRSLRFVVKNVVPEQISSEVMSHFSALGWQQERAGDSTEAGAAWRRFEGGGVLPDSGASLKVDTEYWSGIWRSTTGERMSYKMRAYLEGDSRLAKVVEVFGASLKDQ